MLRKKVVRKKQTTSEKKVSKRRSVKKGLTIPVYAVEGQEMGSLELPKEIFSVEANPKLLAQYTRVYLANKRQGTASSKTRGEVRGSTRKIYRQKGTGRARHGDIKAPIFVGGGVVGGPKPRDYSLRLSKRQIRRALFNALTLKVKMGGILGISDKFIKVEPKTKKMKAFFDSLDLDNKNILLILPKLEKNNLILASRNLPKVTMLDAMSLNAYEVLKSEKLLLLESALKVLEGHFLKTQKAP